VKKQGILIVEDENIVALDMRMRLETMGYCVVDVVDSGALACERARSLKPDLVLMDIKLKGDQDGIDVASQLRETSEVPVIFVTAFTDEKTLDRAKHASPYGYIVKPFHERELRIAIELAIYKHQYELSIRRARDIAEESNRVKSEFLANMSHELKTPLNSVIGFTELALAQATEDEQRDELAIALSSARSLLTLIDSILDFARMEAGKLTAVSAPFCLDELLDGCVDALAVACRPKGIEVAFRRASAVPNCLVGDRDLLKHILLNLLDNAAKFTDEGTIRLSVGLCDQPNGPRFGPTFQFEVSDTGIGMAKDKIGAAFARFTQLDPSKTRRAGGTGLGLAIVSKSVELMGGCISVESEEGRGTTFLLRIPFELSPEESSSRHATERSGVAALIGFGDEAFEDASFELERMGLEARQATSLADAAQAKLIIVDERAFPSLEGELASSDAAHIVASALVVGTRLGGNLRARLASQGIACASLPLRLSGLRAAIMSLGTGKARPRVPAVDASNRKFAPSPQQMEALAQTLERAFAAKAFGEAEREAQKARDTFAELGDHKASRLAFAALLAARKSDEKALADILVQMRGEKD
jgi:signal transduction histidine kinase